VRTAARLLDAFGRVHMRVEKPMKEEMLDMMRLPAEVVQLALLRALGKIRPSEAF
jgi:hypothetical protein